MSFMKRILLMFLIIGFPWYARPRVKNHQRVAFVNFQILPESTEQQNNAN